MTREELKTLLHYNLQTGVFTWLAARNSGRNGQIAGTRRLDGYWMIMLKRTHHFAHRLAFLYMTGAMPRGEVDHINGERADNKWANLRDCTREQNRKNLRLYKSSTTGVPGVSWHKHRGKWHARIGKDGKRISLGYFAEIDAAIAARREATRVVFGEFARQV